MSTELENHLDSAVKALKAENANLRRYLTEITYRKGAYNTDPLEHAGNVIEEAARLAQSALDGKEFAE